VTMVRLFGLSLVPFKEQVITFVGRSLAILAPLSGSVAWLP
jgi:hypothetical protein